MAPVRRLLSAAAVGVIVALGIMPAATASTTQLTPAGAEGLAQIATCLRSNPNLVTLLVVDESGSLQDTDPDNRRAEILADFVLSLASLSGQETPQGARNVQFAANTFSIGSQPLIPWTTLTPDNAQRISSQLRDEIPSLNQGQGTDYEAAIKGARGSISEGVAQVDSQVPPCKLVVWFTDGVLSVGDEAANAESADLLCAVDGPVNALRKEQIHLISVLLFDRATLDQFDEPSRETLKSGIGLLQATAEGTGGTGKYETTCGKVPVPDDYAKGAFFEGNLDALAGQFGKAIAQGIGGTPVPDLAGSPVAFTIEPGFTSFWVTALAPDGFTLASPAGDSLGGAPGSGGGSVAGSQAEVTWSGDTFTAKIPVGQSGYGQWTLTRLGMSDEVGVYLFSDYRLTVDPVELIAGEPANVSGQVTTASGDPADLTGFSAADLSVTQVIDGQKVDPIPFDLDLATGTFSGTFTPETTSTEVRFDLTLALTTKSGFPLAPLTTTFVQQVKLPGAYPQLAPAALDLGSVQNRGDTSASALQIAGSADGPTTVCVQGIILDSTLPDAQVSITSNPAGGCLDVPQAGSATIDVSALLGSGVADGGQVSGAIELTVTNAPTADLPETQERSVQVPFTLQVLPIGPVLWVPFLLTAIGILVPLLVLWFVNWRAARLRLDGIMMARIPVQVPVGAGGIPRRRDGRPGPLLAYEDLAFTPAPPRARSWQPGTETLRARTPWNPFGSVVAQVLASPGDVVISNQPPNSTTSGSRAGVGLCPSMTAYILTRREELQSTPVGEPVDAELVAYLIPGDLRQDAQHLATSITAFAAWGELLADMKQQDVSRERPDGSAGGSTDTTELPPLTQASPEPTQGSRFDMWTPPPDTGAGPSAPPASPPPGSDKPPTSGNRFTL